MKSFRPNLPWAELYVRSGLKTLSDRVRQRPIVRRVRGAVDELRTTVRDAARQRLPVVAEHIIRQVFTKHDCDLLSCINATGVIAPRGLTLPLPDAALAAMASVSESYSIPSPAAETLLAELANAEAAIVLHSPAVAAIAVLQALGGRTVVARDQIGELDGVPLASLAQSADIELTEIGSVGRVSRDDYRDALTLGKNGCLWYSRPQTIALTGDLAIPPADEVFALARDRRYPVVECLEAATLIDISSMSSEGPAIPLVSASLSAGADLVIFPGDRFVGGPHCGIVVGKSELVTCVAKHPFARVSVIDSARLAALVATLQLIGKPNGPSLVPTLQLLIASAENLKHRAERLAAQIRECATVAAAEAVSSPGFLQDGRLSCQEIAGWSVAIIPVDVSPEEMAEKLRNAQPSILASVEAGRVQINLRSVLARQDAQVTAAFQGGNREILPLQGGVQSA